MFTSRHQTAGQSNYIRVCLYYTVYTQKLLSSLRYISMICFGSLLIHLQVTYHVVDYIVAMLLLIGYP
jgi:hypothetical protein